MSRLEELGGLEPTYGAQLPRTPDLDAISTSDSAPEDEAPDVEDDASVSKLASSPPPGSPEPAPEVRCMWEDCGEMFTNLQPFIEHLHNFHIGIHKSRYACEWNGCPRKGKSQTSRFALLSHLRSHTGEKPFTCPRPECDKSFTRSDALAKHMRVQHNTPPQNQGARDPDESRDTHGAPAARRADDELLDLAEGERPGGAAAPAIPTLLVAQRFASDTHAQLPSHEARELESVLQRARTLETGEQRKRTRHESPGSSDEEEPLADEAARERVLHKYLVEKAKLRAGLRTREQWLSHIQALRREEGELRQLCRSTLDQLLAQRLGPEYAETMLSPPASPT